MSYATKAIESEYHRDAQKVLAKAKRNREGKNLKMVRVDRRTWKEVEQ